jgi:hypothetical protein
MTDKTPPLKDVLAGLSKEQLRIMMEAIEAGKKGFKYDTKTGQRDFGFNRGGEVCRGQGRVSRKRKFKTY